MKHLEELLDLIGGEVARLKQDLSLAEWHKERAEEEVKKLKAEIEKLKAEKDKEN